MVLKSPELVASFAKNVESIYIYTCIYVYDNDVCVFYILLVILL